VFNNLRDKGYKLAIIFGNMGPEERDREIAKFRERKTSVIITTNMLSRGFDVSEVKLVINFDVPTQRVHGM
jgi:ATP-dependent RNA helicase DDX19/DBP5